MRYQLRGVTHALRDQTFAIVAEKRLVLGRLATSDIVLDDSSVSRRHCTLHQTDEQFCVRDEKSVNGTYVNGVRIGMTDHPLQHRDLLQVGKVVLLVEQFAEIDADVPIFVLAREA